MKQIIKDYITATWIALSIIIGGMIFIIGLCLLLAGIMEGIS